MWNEVQVAGFLFIAFWPLVVLAILIAGRRWPRARTFADKMLAQWKPSTIALIALEHRKGNTYALRPS